MNLYRVIALLAVIFITVSMLSGCASGPTYYAGAGYDVGNNPFTVNYNGTEIFKTDQWNNPVGIIGVRYNVHRNIALDYRHISSIGGHDMATSDAVSVLIEIGGKE